MRFKLLLFTVFVAGVGASLALAESGKPKDTGPACSLVHLEGTAAPQSLTMTVSHSGPAGAVAAGTQVTLSVGATGQTVRVNAEACASGSSFVVKSLELHPVKSHTSDGTTTTKTGGDGDRHGDAGSTTTTAPVTTTTTP